MGARLTEDGVLVGAAVVLSLHNPKERVWGQLLNLNAAGITLKAIDLGSFDEFIRQAKDLDHDPIGLPTVFYPLVRVERVALDEERGGVPSLAQTFEQQVGMSLEEHLDRV